MFQDLIMNIQGKVSGIFPVDEYVLDGVLMLIENSRNQSQGIECATFDLSLWFNDFLTKYYTYIKYVSKTPDFSILLNDDRLHEKIYRCEKITFNSDEELDEFFQRKKGNTIVLYTIGKFINLKTLSVFYLMRYADITHKRQKRDILIDKIIE